MSFYQYNDEWVRVCFTANCGKEKQSDTNTALNKTVIVIDNSGSMQGAPLEGVRAAVRYINSQTGKDNAPDFMVYNSTARLITSKEAENIKATGMTNFSDALNLIEKQITTVYPVGANVSVIFMTDGHDTASPGGQKGLNTRMNSFKLAVKYCDRNVVLHSIGFSKSHSKDFLDQLGSLGTKKGMYRYCETNGDLDIGFGELFDFLSTNQSKQLKVGTLTQDVDCEIEDNHLKADVMIRLKDCGLKSPLESLAVSFSGGREIDLENVKADVIFELKILQETEINSKEELGSITSRLKKIQPYRVRGADRDIAVDLAAAIQEKLDALHQLFADIARGKLAASSNAVDSRMHSLMYDHKFTKVRRKRCMNQRADRNAADFQSIPNILKSIFKNLTEDDFDTFKEVDYVCPLSGDSARDIMAFSDSDIVVFGLRVLRPELVVDAPTTLNIETVVNGTYSNSALTDAINYAVKSTSHAAATGGFQDTNTLNPDVGYFVGTDGKSFNACLPMYINEHHWKRVELQLEPILGYFFTLDPLGFKSDQYLALFAILGQMLTLRSNNQFTSDWADTVISDLSKVCKAIKPKVMAYINGPHYKGKLTTDPLTAFVSSTEFRLKEVMPNLLTIIGWRHVFGNPDGVTDEKFSFIFIEELWRRAFNRHFKHAQPNITRDFLSELIYGKVKEDFLNDDDVVCDNGISAAAKVGLKRDKRFEAFAKYKLDLLSRKNTAEAKKFYSNSHWYKRAAPAPAASVQVDDEVYVERPLIIYSDLCKNPEVDALVQNVLDQIKEAVPIKTLTEYLNFAPLGIGFSEKEKWIMVLQALFYNRDADCKDGRYLSTVDHLHDLNTLVAPIHESFEKIRREAHASKLEMIEVMNTSKEIVRTSDRWAYVGRLMKFCPTRGGKIFDSVIGYLTTNNVNGKQIDDYEFKVKTIMTGKFESYNVLSDGAPWIHCHPNIAYAIKQHLSEEAFIDMEIAMRCHAGWTYRESDMPNRHGFHNSHPNPKLVISFQSFNLDQFRDGWN